MMVKLEGKGRAHNKRWGFIAEYRKSVKEMDTIKIKNTLKNRKLYDLPRENVVVLKNELKKRGEYY